MIKILQAYSLIGTANRLGGVQSSRFDVRGLKETRISINCCSG